MEPIRTFGLFMLTAVAEIVGCYLTAVQEYSSCLHPSGEARMTAGEPNDRAAHWEAVYQQKAPTAVSWYRGHLDTSLALLEQAGMGPDSRVIDVGGGASTLVDDLLDRDVRTVAVLDLSAKSLDVARARLGPRAGRVTWLTGDVTRLALPTAAYTHWHDRAVLHFLTKPDDVQAYAAQAAHAIVPGGHAVIGGFSPDGPERCSGLPVTRRSAHEIAAALGPSFALVTSVSEQHRTPDGAEQSFAYALLRREP
ncbi:methyltransferase domain-containing protein [Luteimonas soli]|uniref:Methyltransferase domain-containing protein n=1 Tax=Luteimonas soli TaxID=1648966 RepID=A0ABV7XJX0_9GAMM